jgi:hypothetical protein
MAKRTGGGVILFGLNEETDFKIVGLQSGALALLVLPPSLASALDPPGKMNTRLLKSFGA